MDEFKDTPAFKDEVLNKLFYEDFEADRESFDEFFAFFEKKSLDLIEKITKAYEQKQTKEFERHCHNLKSNCRTIGLNQTGELCEMLENLPASQVLNTDLTQKLKNLAALFNEGLGTAKSYLNDLNLKQAV